jgi:hypothetical protein
MILQLLSYPCCLPKSKKVPTEKSALLKEKRKEKFLGGVAEDLLHYLKIKKKFNLFCMIGARLSPKAAPNNPLQHPLNSVFTFGFLVVSFPSEFRPAGLESIDFSPIKKSLLSSSRLKAVYDLCHPV